MPERELVARRNIGCRCPGLPGSWWLPLCISYSKGSWHRLPHASIALAGSGIPGSCGTRLAHPIHRGKPAVSCALKHGCLLRLGFSEPHSISYSSALKNRLDCTSADTPESRRPREEPGERRALIPTVGGQRYLREIRGFGHPAAKRTKPVKLTRPNVLQFSVFWNDMCHL